MEQQNSPIFQMITSKANESSYDDLVENLKALMKNKKKDEDSEE